MYLSTPSRRWICCYRPANKTSMECTGEWTFEYLAFHLHLSSQLFVDMSSFFVAYVRAHLIYPQSVISSCFDRWILIMHFMAVHPSSLLLFCLCHVHFILFLPCTGAAASGTALPAWLCRLNWCKFNMHAMNEFFFLFRFCCILCERQPNACKRTISSRILTCACVSVRKRNEREKMKQIYVSNRIAVSVAADEWNWVVWSCDCCWLIRSCRSSLYRALSTFRMSWVILVAFSRSIGNAECRKRGLSQFILILTLFFVCLLVLPSKCSPWPIDKLISLEHVKYSISKSKWAHVTGAWKLSRRSSMAGLRIKNQIDKLIITAWPNGPCLDCRLINFNFIIRSSALQRMCHSADVYLTNRFVNEIEAIRMEKCLIMSFKIYGWARDISAEHWFLRDFPSQARASYLSHTEN